MELFPLTAGTDIIASTLSVITANAFVVVSLLGFGLGVRFVRKMVNKSGNGRV